MHLPHINQLYVSFVVVSLLLVGTQIDKEYITDWGRKGKNWGTFIFWFKECTSHQHNNTITLMVKNHFSENAGSSLFCECKMYVCVLMYLAQLNMKLRPSLKYNISFKLLSINFKKFCFPKLNCLSAKSKRTTKPIPLGNVMRKKHPKIAEFKGTRQKYKNTYVSKLNSLKTSRKSK